MIENKNGYLFVMTAKDVMNDYKPTEDKLIEGFVWGAYCFGPVINTEVVLFKDLLSAYKWVVNGIGDSVVDEMGYRCWKDIDGSGTEWEIKLIKLP